MNCDSQPIQWCVVLWITTCLSVTTAEDLAKWQSLPIDFKPAAKTETSVTLQRGNTWAYLCSPREYTNLEVAATVSIENPATQFDFFGATWSAWPDTKFEDRGFEAALLIRGSEDGSHGYRVQLSSKYQEVALVRFPDGGYVRSVPCSIRTQTPIRLRVAASGGTIRVWIDDQEVIHYVDQLQPALSSGRVAIGTSSSARVIFSELAIKPVDAEPKEIAPSHRLRLTTRKWLGGRIFVFDNDEPILQLHDEQDPSCFAKLMPGDKPRLTFDSHWALENQGAFPDAKVKWTMPEVSGTGDSVRATWSARHINNRFVTKSELVVGYDSERGTYTHDVDSELEVLPGEPYQFRYGFDFEHHTPLDPFRWQYLLIRDRQGLMRYRPLSPFDPGTMEDIESNRGLRIWHGRVSEDYRVSPAVEYRIRPEWKMISDSNGTASERKLNTSVCAAFYDTGVAYASSVAAPGDRIRVQYRYTGYMPRETAALFASAQVQDNPRIDPKHHFLFLRDQWPTIRFEDALAMDKPWWGGRPLMSGHNRRPAYDLAVDGDRRVLKLGPASYAAAAIGPEKVESGRYLVTARVKSINTHGPGGKIELLTLKKADLHGNGYVRFDNGNIIGEQSRYFGNGTFNWREISFVAEVPKKAGGLGLGLGNDGTGEVLVSDVHIEPLGVQPPPAETVLIAPPTEPVVQDALWDLRMQEQQGLHVYNYGSSNFKILELANVDWIEDEGHRAIAFSENPVGRRDFPNLGILDQYLRNPNQRQNFEPVCHGAFGLAGGPHEQIGPLKGLTLSAWIKPAAEMGKSTSYGGKGDIIGFGARRFILGLEGQSAPYSLLARINVNDRFESTAKLHADRWYHVAMTCTPSGENWQIRLYLNGQEIGSGTSKSFPVSSVFPDSLVLGAELYYLHGAYYRGLMSDVQVIGRALTTEEIRSTLTLTPP